MEQSEILQYLAELTGIEGHAFHRAILLEVVVWFVMIAAVIIDFSTGIRNPQILSDCFDIIFQSVFDHDYPLSHL